MAFFNPRLRTEAALLADGEPDDFVSEYEGEIICVEEESGAESVVGRVRALRLQATNAANNRYSLYDVCDCHSHELHILHAMLYEEKGYAFKAPLATRFEANESDLLILEHIIFAPKWRRLKVGLLAARKMVDLLGSGCGLVVSHIAPLERRASEALQVPRKWLPKHSRETRKSALLSMRRYFRQMEFERLGRSVYYAMPVALVTPSANDLLNPTV